MTQLSKFNVWNKKNQQIEKCNAREEMMNILTYVDFAKLCNVIKSFPELNQKL